jgi:hypothetical protein
MGLQPIPFSRSGTCPGLAGPRHTRPSSVIKRKKTPPVNLPIAERNEKSVFPPSSRLSNLLSVPLTMCEKPGFLQVAACGEGVPPLDRNLRVLVLIADDSSGNGGTGYPY